MQTKFGNIGISNVPIINQWNQFLRYYNLVVEQQFIEKVTHRGLSAPIETPYETWYGMPNELITTLFMRSFIGLEAYIKSAVRLAAGLTGRLDESTRKSLQNPFILGRGTVLVLYNKLPSSIQTDLSLQQSNRRLYEETSLLYSGFRNPLFHGSQISNAEDCAEDLKSVMRHLLKLYHWIEFWPIEKWDDVKDGHLPGLSDKFQIPLIFRTGLSIGMSGEP